jgi:hypothetical protein
VIFTRPAQVSIDLAPRARRAPDGLGRSPRTRSEMSRDGVNGDP